MRCYTSLCRPLLSTQCEPNHAIGVRDRLR
jgi:hypothetical protein